VTHTYIKTVEQPTIDYLTRSVRRKAASFKSRSEKWGSCAYRKCYPVRMRLKSATYKKRKWDNHRYQGPPPEGSEFSSSTERPDYGWL